MRRSLGRAGLIIGASALAVACSGDGDASPLTTTVVPTTIESTTTEAPATSTTTDAPATSSSTTIGSTTTVAPTTTASETTAPSTTLPEGVPPRVTFPDDPDKQAVVDAVYAYFDALNAAQAEPFDSSLRWAVQATVVAPVEQRVLSYLDRLAGDSEAFLPGDQPSLVEVVADSVVVSGSSATVDACVVDWSVHVKIGVAPGDGDDVITDAVFSALLSYSVEFVNGTWFVADVTVFDEFEGQTSCV